jgi:hypothetical protein
MPAAMGLANVLCLKLQASHLNKANEIEAGENSR